MFTKKTNEFLICIGRESLSWPNIRAFDPLLFVDTSRYPSRIPSHFQHITLPLEDVNEERMELHNPSYHLPHQEEHHRRIGSLTAVWWEQEDSEAGV
ncbi:hypothetical protein LSAT2_000933, partial [Lamellibrachia satsuma]